MKCTALPGFSSSTRTTAPRLLRSLRRNGQSRGPTGVSVCGEEELVRETTISWWPVVLPDVRHFVCAVTGLQRALRPVI
ncbi:unnamed protein product [Protopolystoma xenopodis]|uniref:Uncharacterized protein n=1 Tax=Protopolystoma xenopodis TaxID=117903 RepID=A0A448XJK2_9PLAT|nr:unnamed protein product [Protopolystoma xenopodis]